MRKYWQFFYIEFLHGFYYRAVILGRVSFYGLLLFIFSRLWLVTAKYNSLFTAKEMIWYLALTELIVLSLPLVHVEIEEDVRSGNLAYFLLRPASYLWSRYFRALGAAFSRLLVMAVAGFAYAWCLVGLLPNSSSLLWFLPLGLLAMMVGTLFQLIIGLFAFWLQDSSPLYWVWQKLLFILGGLILPLSIYPVWLQKVSQFTVFPYLLHFPATISLRPNPHDIVVCVLALLLWGLLGIFIGNFIFRRACQDLVINGG